MSTAGSDQIERVRTLVQEHAIDTVILGGTDIDGVWRGKRVPAGYFLDGVWRTGSRICNVLFGWDVADEIIPGLDYVGWDGGFPDFSLIPDLSTFAVVPWQPRTASVIGDFHQLDGTPVALSPRQVLRGVLDRATQMGFEARVGVEFEFYLFRESPASLRAKDFADLDPVTPAVNTYSLSRMASVAPLINDLVRSMSDYGFSLEAANIENGPGQFEINLHHQTAMTAADQVVLYKQAVREISAAHGVVATFMAKYREDWAGSSGHIHQSLWGGDGANAFADAAQPGNLSELAGRYAAGQLATMGDVTALLCPTVNSYKRIVPGIWAPTTVTVGLDNRSTALRMVAGRPDACRIEHRLPGADANPYLAVAATIAGGLYGIEHDLTPPPPLMANAYDLEPSQVEALPRTLDEAVDALQESKVARTLLGDHFVDHFVSTRRWELQRSRRAVTDWERRRYFEMI